MTFNVDLPNRELENVLCLEKELGNYMIMLESELASLMSNDEVLSSLFGWVILSDASPSLPSEIIPPTTQNKSQGIWIMHFDSARAKCGYGASIVFTCPSSIIMYMFHLEFACTKAAYEALLLDLQAMREEI
jgi:hypothetical protein